MTSSCSESLFVGVVQLCSGNRVELNLERIASIVKAEAERLSPVSLLVLPENAFQMSSGGAAGYLRLSDSEFERLSGLVQQTRISVLIGSVALMTDDGPYNSMVFLEPDRPAREVYRKIHLFDVEVQGAAPSRESDRFGRGITPQVLELQGFKLGLSICYDLRFSELFSLYYKAGVDALLVPSAFLVATGIAHWEVLLRARAIEGQCYVLAPAQAGHHLDSTGLGGGRWTYGNSLIVGPWGDVLARAAGSGECVLRFEMRRQDIDSVRRQIPMSMHRRI